MNRISTDEKTLTRFLLGDLPEAERERIEGALIFDSGLHERIAAVEFDLVDDYVRGRLAGEELARFESHYLASPPNRERVRLARELPDLQREHRAQAAAARPEGATAPVADPPGRPGFWQTVRSFIAPLGPAAPYAFAALLAAAALGGGWLLFVRGGGANGGQGQVARVEPSRPPSTPANNTPSAPTPSAPPDADPSPTPPTTREQPTPTPTQANSPPRRPGREGGTGPTGRQASVVALALVPGMARGEGDGNTLVVPPGADVVRLDVALPPQDYRGLRAEIQTVEGRRVWSGVVRRTGRSGGGQNASVSVPARLLDEDDYLLTVTGAVAGGEAGKVESFYFKALRR